MSLKEAFLAIKTYDEFDKRRCEFRTLSFDKEVVEHLNEIFGRFDNVPNEVFKNAPGKGKPLWE